MDFFGYLIYYLLALLIIAYLTINSKRIGFDGTVKTPSLSLLKPTASSLGHRVAKVANSSSYMPTYPSMKFCPNTTKTTAQEQQQQRIDNDADQTNMSISPQKQHSPLNPFRNVYMDDESQHWDHFDALDGKASSFDNKEPIQQHTHLSPAKRPLDHSPFPTPLQRRQSEPLVKREYIDPGRGHSKHDLRMHLFDPVATQLLDQEEVFASFSSIDQALDPENDMVETESVVDRSYIRYNSMPNMIIPNSPRPLFRQVSSSLHDVKTEDDLNSLARPVPRKLSS